MNYQNDLILRAARGEYVERVPVWMMRQAGRILPEYRAIRQRLKDFKELVETPELACEVTLQPVDILGVDAAIIFSDILVIPEAMGCTYEMKEKTGPIFPSPIRSQADIERLIVPNPEEHLRYVLDAIRLTTKELNGRVPLIGFAGAPWTILAYMIEGSGSKTFSIARKFLYNQAPLAHQLLQKITDATIAYLRAQVEAGAAIVQLFDSWAGVLPQNQYETFSLLYIRQICDALSPHAPVTVFAKGAYSTLDQLNETSCSVVGLDWNMSIAEARHLVPSKTLQGNLDPCLLYADADVIRAETIRMIERFGVQRYIANLGHGVYPDTNPDHVRVFIDTVKEYQKIVL